jgi:hypothetical protein
MLTTVNEHTFDYGDQHAVTWVLAERGALGLSDECHRGVRC